MRTKKEAKEMLNKLELEKKSCAKYSNVKCESNYTEGWIESLEIILDLYDRNVLEVFNRRVFEYQYALISRYENDIEVFGKDITNGWLEGSIESINWFLNN